MPDEATEQPSDAVAEQPEPTTEQPSGDVAVSDAQDVAATSEEDVAEAPVEPDLAALLASDDGINRVLEDERFKTLRGRLEKEAKDAELRGRQAFEKEMRQKQASDEVLAERLEMVAKVKGWDVEDEDLKQILAASHEPVIQREQRRLNQLYFEQAKSTFNAEAQQAIDMAWAQAGEDVESQNSIIGQLWQFRDQSSRASAIADLSFEQVPESSKLRKDIDAHVQQEVEKELKAREDAANRIETSPRASTGTAPGASRDQEIDEILRNAKPSTPEYQQAYQEKYGFALPVR